MSTFIVIACFIFLVIVWVLGVLAGVRFARRWL